MPNFFPKVETGYWSRLQSCTPINYSIALHPLISGDDDDDEEDSAKKEERERKRQEEDESLFHRLEESRLMLEQELGFDKFLRVYKYLQV